jgi:glycosyltransferase involved in cell wall biosynthesis
MVNSLFKYFKNQNYIMRFLHIGINICGIPNSIRDAQIKLGHTAKTLSFCPEPPHTSDFDYDVTYSLGNISSIIKRMWILFKIGKNYDIFHFTSNSLVDGIDIILWKLMGKKIIIHYHGSEIRNKKQPFFHKFADIFFVSTPDLLKFVPNAIWIPNPIDINKYKHSNPPESLIISHAPTNQLAKGTNEIIRSIKNTQLKIPNLTFNLIFGIPYNEALDYYRNSTIVIDQIKIGWYGMVSLECMAMGTPTMCYISQDLLQYIPAANHPLFITSEKTLESDILFLINNKNIRDKQIEYGKQYVSTTHNSENIAYKIINSLKERNL